MPFRLSSALLCLQNVAATPISRRLLVLRSRGLLLSLYIKTFFPSVPRVAPSAARNAVSLRRYITTHKDARADILWRPLNV